MLCKRTSNIRFKKVCGARLLLITQVKNTLSVVQVFHDTNRFVAASSMRAINLNNMNVNILING